MNTSEQIQRISESLDHYKVREFFNQIEQAKKNGVLKA